MPTSRLRTQVNGEITTLVKNFFYNTNAEKKYSVFVEDNQTAIQHLCSITAISIRYWNSCFSSIALELNVPILMDKPDWSFLTNNTSPSTTTSISSMSGNGVFHDETITISTFNIMPLPTSQHLIINGVDVSTEFQPFKVMSKQILANSTDRNVSRDLERMLAVSSILFLEKVVKANSSLFDIFNERTLKSIYNYVLRQFTITTRITDTTFIAIKNALNIYSSNPDELDDIECSETFEKTINNLKYATTDRVLKRVLHTLVLLANFLTVNEKVRSEMDVQSSYINVAINSLFKLSRNHNPHCSNLLSDNSATHQECRPDYKVEVLDSRNQIYVNLNGEVKPINSLTHSEDLATDSYRIGLFSKIAINDYGLNAVMAYQAIDTDITFYVMKTYQGLEAFAEYETINIPTTYSSFCDIVKDLDKMYKVSSAYEVYCKKAVPPTSAVPLTSTVPTTSAVPLTSTVPTTSAAPSTSAVPPTSVVPPTSAVPPTSTSAVRTTSTAYSRTSTLPYKAFKRIGCGESSTNSINGGSSSSSSNGQRSGVSRKRAGESRSGSERRLRTVRNGSCIRSSRRSSSH